MTLVKEPDEALNSIQIRRLGANRVLQYADARSYLVQHAQRRGRGRGLIGRSDGGDGFHGFFGPITLYACPDTK